jgi:hypothetical protein
LNKLPLTQFELIVAKICKRKRQGISPVLATIMIFGLIISGVMITFIQVIPYIEQAQSEEAVSTVRNSFLELDTAIKSLLSESNNPGGFRTVLFTKPAGRIDFDPNFYRYSLRLYDSSTDSDFEYYILRNQDIGVLDWNYNSPREILPRGSTKYVTGPDPYKTRSSVILTGIFASTTYQDLTNLELSHLDDRLHHITLNYRISIYLSISTNPEPEIYFQIFLIQLSADFESIHSQYRQITIQSNYNVSTPRTSVSSGSLGTLDIVWDDFQLSGMNSTTIWSSQSIQGFNPSYFNIVVQTIIFEIGLSIS